MLGFVNFVYISSNGNAKIQTEGRFDMIDYSPLWETMKRQGVTQYRLLEDKIIDNKTLNGLKHNKNITLLTLEKLCKYLQCTPNDIVRFTDD